MSSPEPALPARELVLDRYRPLRPLGSGASGSVWLARDEQTGLDVALKIVPREGKAGSRAEREAEAASRLRHERCLRSHAFGADMGHVYIAYEYVGGRTLREAMRTDGLTDAEAVEAAAQILDGLAHAHRRGIVHRDIKPSNILLADEEGISVRVLDFGLAQFDEAETLTAAGDVPGTLAYISPERLLGREATYAADVWAVGVLLWEALVGEHPFWGVPIQQMANAIEAGPPALAAKRPDLPARLLNAVGRALSLEPGRRPTASALASELRAGLTDTRRKRARRSASLPHPHVSFSLPHVEVRLVSAGLAGIAAGVGAAILPFYPVGWAAGLGLAAGLVTLRAPRAGLAVALAAPVFPLGNLALGLALLYGALAAGSLALCWRDARGGLVFLAGPMLAPFGALGLVPLAVQPARGPIRRAAHAAAAVAAAAGAAALAGGSVPIVGGRFAASELAGLESPLEAARILWAALPPQLALEAAALAALAAAIPYARARGLWGIALLGAAMLAATLLLAPAAPALPLVVAAWVTCLGLGWRAAH